MTHHSRRVERDPYVRMMFRQLPGALWTTDRNLCLTYVAGRLANDVHPRAKPGMFIFDIIGTQDPSHTVIARHREALSGESQSFEFQFNGRWYKIFIEQLAEDSGEVAGCIAAAFDITEQRAMQESLARSEALLAESQRIAH